MEIIPHDKGFAILKDGKWCSWASTTESAEKEALEWEHIGSPFPDKWDSTNCGCCKIKFRPEAK